MYMYVCASVVSYSRFPNRAWDEDEQVDGLHADTEAVDCDDQHVVLGNNREAVENPNEAVAECACVRHSRIRSTRALLYDLPERWPS